MSKPEPSLAEEARYLHGSLFSRPMDPQIAERYARAHLVLFADERRTTVNRIVSRRLDVEAVEFALRRRRLCPELTRKIQILCYLVEVRADYRSSFVASRPRKVRAILALAWRIPASAWKLLKGECLVRLYGLL
jgi:hypothetical protein